MYLLHRKNIHIYTNISPFLSYSEVTVATRSSPYPAQMITADTRSSPYPDQMITADTRSSPYPDQMITAVTRSSPYPDQMVDQHLEMTSATLIFRHIACLFTSVRKLPAIAMNEE